MFTTGRIVFLISFLIAFIIGMIYAYRKDLKYEKQWYKNSWKVLLGIFAIAYIYYLLARI